MAALAHFLKAPPALISIIVAKMATKSSTFLSLSCLVYKIELFLSPTQPAEKERKKEQAKLKEPGTISLFVLAWGATGDNMKLHQGLIFL